MLLACGVIKKATYESMTTRFPSFSVTSKKSYKVDPAVPPVIDGEAHNKPDSESSD